jgi:hypothetical protein
MAGRHHLQLCMSEQHTQSTIGTAGEPSESELSRDTLFHVLGNRRRRWAIRYLTHEREVTVGELAEQLAAWEQEMSREQVTAEQRKRTYTSLQQTHLPVLEDADVIDFDPDRGVVAVTEQMEALDIYLEVVPKRTIPWSMYYLGIGIVSCAVVGITAIINAGFINADPFAVVPPLGWAVLISLTVTVSGAVHTYRTRAMRLDSGGLPPEVNRDS